VGVDRERQDDAQEAGRFDAADRHLSGEFALLEAPGGFAAA
jgi:hypothetical protein